MPRNCSVASHSSRRSCVPNTGYSKLDYNSSDLYVSSTLDTSLSSEP